MRVTMSVVMPAVGTMHMAMILVVVLVIVIMIMLVALVFTRSGGRR